jgi:hypothetical protein
MRQKRDMKRDMTEHQWRTVAAAMEYMIEDLLDAYRDADWTQRPKDAVDLHKIVLTVRALRIERGDPRPIELPPGLEAVVNDCARRGMGKGTGKGQKHRGIIKEFLHDEAFLAARGRKAELRAQGESAEDAGDMAAKEIAKALADDFGSCGIILEPGSILRRW